MLVAAVYRPAGVTGGHAVRDVSLNAFELRLLGGVFNGAREGLRALLPLGSAGSHFYTVGLGDLSHHGHVAEYEGLYARPHEAGESVQVPAHHAALTVARHAVLALHVRLRPVVHVRVGILALVGMPVGAPPRVLIVDHRRAVIPVVPVVVVIAREGGGLRADVREVFTGRTSG